ncbi:UNVERIFIED_CONTAM: hypothetical protein FKN15_069811 [Acipenser sinensis]
MDYATLSALLEQLDSRREVEERRREERVVAQKLCDHMIHWLTPALKTTAQMGEAIVIEQFCHVVGAETQGWIRRHNPDTLEQAVKLAEDFEDSLVSAQTGLLTPLPQRSSRAPPPLSAPPTPPPGPVQRPPRAPTPMGDLASSSWRPRCRQPGHQARSCPSAMECDVAVCNLASEADS